MAPDQDPSPGTAPSTWLTPSHLLEYLYCPRFTFYEYVLGVPEHQGLRFKVQKGREIHEERTKVNPSYLRRKLGVTARENDVELDCPALGIRGIVDEVLTLDDGTMAPLDYKYAEWKGRIFKNQKAQAAMYGLMIQHIYQRPVQRAFFCYTRSQYKIEELQITPDLYTRTLRDIEDCLEVIQNGYFPQPTSAVKRCGDCCYRNICIK